MLLLGGLAPATYRSLRFAMDHAWMANAVFASLLATAAYTFYVAQGNILSRQELTIARGLSQRIVAGTNDAALDLLKDEVLRRRADAALSLYAALLIYEVLEEAPALTAFISEDSTRARCARALLDEAHRGVLSDAVHPGGLRAVAADLASLGLVSAAAPPEDPEPDDDALGFAEEPRTEDELHAAVARLGLRAVTPPAEAIGALRLRIDEELQPPDAGGGFAGHMV
mmetsp:Transcript_19549/g.59146  ORF Transcript_19549/g.59146 Transcript_19549/m.59146 type:complete len:227 (-) Transcript_19549:149-829(-)